MSALPCERPGFVPRIRLREIFRTVTVQCEGRTTGAIGAPLVCDEALSDIGGVSLTSGVSGVSKRKFSSEVGYATLPWFPQCEHSTPPDSQNSKSAHKCNAKRKPPSGSIIIGNKPLLA